MTTRIIAGARLSWQPAYVRGPTISPGPRRTGRQMCFCGLVAPEDSGETGVSTLPEQKSTKGEQPNARLTLEGRKLLIERVTVMGLIAAAEAAGIAQIRLTRASGCGGLNGAARTL